MQQKYTVITIFIQTIILQKIDMQYPYNPPFPSHYILSVTSNDIYAVYFHGLWLAAILLAYSC